MWLLACNDLRRRDPPSATSRCCGIGVSAQLCVQLSLRQCGATGRLLTQGVVMNTPTCIRAVTGRCCRRASSGVARSCRGGRSTASRGSPCRRSQTPPLPQREPEPAAARCCIRNHEGGRTRHLCSVRPLESLCRGAQSLRHRQFYRSISLCREQKSRMGRVEDPKMLLGLSRNQGLVDFEVSNTAEVKSSRT